VIETKILSAASELTPIGCAKTLIFNKFLCESKKLGKVAYIKNKLSVGLIGKGTKERGPKLNIRKH